MDFLSRLGLVLVNAKFWSALWVFGQVILRRFVPDFPPDVLDAANMFFAVILALFFASDVGEQRAVKRLEDKGAL